MPVQNVSNFVRDYIMTPPFFRLWIKKKIIVLCWGNVSFSYVI